MKIIPYEVIVDVNSICNNYEQKIKKIKKEKTKVGGNKTTLTPENKEKIKSCLK